eukprot:9502377-Pyramimonas_sp.AAC.1
MLEGGGYRFHDARVWRGPTPWPVIVVHFPPVLAGGVVSPVARRPMLTGDPVRDVPVCRAWVVGGAQALPFRPPPSRGCGGWWRAPPGPSCTRGAEVTGRLSVVCAMSGAPVQWVCGGTCDPCV